MRENKLKLNQDKTKVLLENRKMDLKSVVKPVLDEIALPQEEHICHLAAVLNLQVTAIT